jgi:hypothetical protein
VAAPLNEENLPRGLAVNVFLEDLVLVHAGNLKSRDMMLF